MRTCLSSLFSSETTLKSNHNFLIKTYQSTYYFPIIGKLVQLYPAHCLGHFEFKTLRSSTVVRLLSAAVPQVKNYGKKYFTLRLRRRLYYFLTATNTKREGKSRFCTSRSSFVQWLNSSSVQLAVRSSTWFWRCHSVNIYCWLWVPSPRPSNWMTPNARKGMSLNNPLSRMPFPRLVC